MSGYIGSKASVVSSGAERKKVFTITTTTTSLTGLAYTPTKVHVFHNGIRLVDGTDYTATNGTSITLTNAAENGDEVVVVSYASFQTSDTVSASAGGTFAGDVTVDNSLTVGGSFTSLGIDDNATSTAMTLDSSGFVGINEQNPQAPLHITRNDNSDFIRLECTDGDASEGPQMHFYRNSATPADSDDIGVIKFQGNNSVGDKINYVELKAEINETSLGNEDGRVKFVIQKDGAQRNVVQIGSDGVVFNQDSVDYDFRVESNSNTNMFSVDGATNQVKIGNSTAAGGGTANLSLTGSSTFRAADIDRPTSTASAHIVNFYSNVGGTNTNVAVVECSGDLENVNNRYTGLSDERLKQDIVDANSQWDDIKALQVRKYRFKNHVETMGDDASVQLGVIAQELEASGMNGLVKTKPMNEDDPDGPDRKSVAYSVLYMKAVKALQEAMERIETLEAKVSALEAN